MRLPPGLARIDEIDAADQMQCSRLLPAMSGCGLLARRFDAAAGQRHFSRERNDVARRPGALRRENMLLRVRPLRIRLLCCLRCQCSTRASFAAGLGRTRRSMMACGGWRPRRPSGEPRRDRAVARKGKWWGHIFCV